MGWKAVDGGSDYDIYQGTDEKYAFKIKFIDDRVDVFFAGDDELFEYLDYMHDENQN